MSKPMKVCLLLLALSLMGASAPCATVPQSAGRYGLPGAPPPPPSESVAVADNVITVQQALGDRMFTTITSTYNAKTQMLISMNRHASCCGSYWSSSITQNADGTYDIEAQMNSGQDVYHESRPHFDPHEAEVNVGGYFFIPWMYHVTHNSQIVDLTFSPIDTNFLSIEKTDPAPYPDGVPPGDAALLLKTLDDKPYITLWYDPCTLTLDAYGAPTNTEWVRTDLLSK